MWTCVRTRLSQWQQTCVLRSQYNDVHSGESPVCHTFAEFKSIATIHSKFWRTNEEDRQVSNWLTSSEVRGLPGDFYFKHASCFLKFSEGVTNSFGTWRFSSVTTSKSALNFGLEVGKPYGTLWFVLNGYYCTDCVWAHNFVATDRVECACACSYAAGKNENYELLNISQKPHGYTSYIKFDIKL